VNSILRSLAKDLPDLATLTGVRSGKRTYYQEFQRSNERLQNTVTAMDSISRALVRTVEGPRTLIEEVLRAAAEHLQASWMVIALTDGALPDSRPRLLVMDPSGAVQDFNERLPMAPRRELQLIRSGEAPDDSQDDASDWVRVPMMLDGTPVGGLAGLPGLDGEVEEADLSVLRILANQAAVSMHTSDLYQAGLSLRRRAQQLYDEVSQQARLLTGRTEELRAAEQRLRAADQRELLDSERRRIALELHDSVAQTVLTAGLAVDVLRPEVAALDGGDRLAAHLDDTKGLMVTATEQLRSVIYALHHSRTAEDVAGLPELLAEMAAQHRPHLSVTVRVEGRPLALGTAVEHALARTAGEALFNVAMHARAGRASVRLRYRADCVALRIGDDGRGDPAEMRRTLRLTRGNAADGRHRGLAGMAERAEAMGGTFSIRRARCGGVSIEATVPISDRRPARVGREEGSP
jgi:signal transduction histidine kinase